MKHSVLALVAGLAFCVSALAEEHPKAEHPKAAKPDVIGLGFHADESAECKVLQPKLEAALKAVGDQPIVIVALDRTNDATAAASLEKVAKLGLAKLAKETEGTGFMLLVDARQKKVLGRVTSEMTTEQIEAAIKASLAAAKAAPKVEHPEHPKKAEHPKGEHPKR